MITCFISVVFVLLVLSLVTCFEITIPPSSSHPCRHAACSSSWIECRRHLRPRCNPRRRRRRLLDCYGLAGATTPLCASSSNGVNQQQQQAPSSSRRGLYPSTESIRNGTLQVDELHTLYYQEHGYPRIKNNSINNHDNHEYDDVADDRLVALFLHGGPGAGCTANHARFFDPQYYRVVLFDQRGSGSSTPRGEIRNNTLLQLVHDCERLRIHLLGSSSIVSDAETTDAAASVPPWDVVLGGSWGTTLAIAYAQEYPNSVRSLVLRGVCLLRTCEVDWLFSAQGGAAQLNPEGWKQFAEAVIQLPPSTEAGETDKESSSSVSEVTNIQRQHSAPAQQQFAESEHHRDVLHAYYDLLLSGIPIVRLAAARHWMQWEMSVFTGASASTKKTKNVKNNTASTDETRAMTAAAAVAVHQFSQWSFQDEQGNALSSREVISAQTGFPQQNDESTSSLSCFETVQGLKQCLVATSGADDDQAMPQLEMRPIRPVDETTILPSNNNFTLTTEQEAFVPAQNMLTCYYSVNERFAMDHINLLSPNRMARIQHIPCIAVQGGQDRICPVDTALELAKHWPALNLRIPLNSGHSMYDDAITNELVKATDKFAKELVRKR